ncbi:uncharacterized protein L969DRAFT_104171 [Mixia osmundae IAM 14324]|uniref:Uncharacterized protein n=1 Tax=Mixia osmundae (strain CBS 9802 / IAM 14324 / JCM 22182 / KY 12970) TaxID=764103 RepID=G7DZ67_MIXOS|nr:uncharacterized protein L969DRAFT_104171 [Mixia osmundae IAM 14324]KEI38278.1 hypothetical protein L969DRAFT_104171 [Mixia osmundae IAM 14324]GAA95877.1 hypothetical protein E5Q_02534 [Mixia osmundae IAM 14324]
MRFFRNKKGVGKRISAKSSVVSNPAEPITADAGGVRGPTRRPTELCYAVTPTCDKPRRSLARSEMWCLRYFLVLIVFLPFPSTPPLFLLLIIATLALHYRPCFYCTLLMLGLMASSCHWHLGLEPHQQQYMSSQDTAATNQTVRVLRTAPSAPVLNPHSLSTSNATNATQEATDDRRCWFNLNGGHLLAMPQESPVAHVEKPKEISSLASWMVNHSFAAPARIRMPDYLDLGPGLRLWLRAPAESS